MYDLVGVQEIRFDRGSMKPAGEYMFFYRKGNEIHELSTEVFMHKRIISAVKRVEFVSDRMWYIILRGHWCDTIVLKVHAPPEDKNVYFKDSFYLGFPSSLFHKLFYFTLMCATCSTDLIFLD
jgi:hypothetical protein